MVNNLSPNGAWPAPQLLYPVPIKPPTVDPDFTPANVAISCYWLPIVHGACKVLLQQSTWKTDDPVELAVVLGRAQNLLDAFTDAIESAACDGILPAISCAYMFVDDPSGWTAQVLAPYGDLAIWRVDRGWDGVTVIDNPGECLSFLDIELDLSATHIDLSSIRVIGDRLIPAGGAFNGVLTYTAGTPTAFGFLPAGIGNFDVTLHGSALDVEKIVIDLGSHLVGSPCNDGPNTIAFVQINGVAATSPCP